MDRIGLVFLILVAIMVVVSLLENKEPDKKAVQLDADLFRTSTIFNLGAVAIIGLLAVIYAIFW